MKIVDYKVKYLPWNDLKGWVKINRWFSYEVFGPFGQGYNIKISRWGPKAELKYHWKEDPGAFAKTPTGNYSIAPQGIFAGEDNILKVSEGGEFIPVKDEFAMGLFVVNYLFYRKEQPFIRSHA